MISVYLLLDFARAKKPSISPHPDNQRPWAGYSPTSPEPDCQRPCAG